MALLKLNVGCGEKPIRKPGWVNVDVRPLPGVDVVAPVDALPFADGDCELLYACHVLEHVRRPDTGRVLAEWRRVLRPGGILRVAVPDLEVAMRTYLLGHRTTGRDVRVKAPGDLEHEMGQLYGRQDYPENTHHQGFDYRRLADVLADAGFDVLGRYDWRETEHADVDDFSQSYWPHMDRSGLLRSLNVEARRV